jgi:hypothetical protein
MVNSALTALPPGSMPPSRASLMLLAGLLAVLLACGKIKEKLTEQVAEKAVEQATGQEIDLENGRVQVRDDKGNAAEWGAGAKLPDGWPAQLGPYPGSQLIASYAARNNDKLSGSIAMKTSAKSEQVLAHYTKLLADFKLSQEMNMNGSQTKVFQKDGQTVTINVLPKEKETQATLVLANF